MIQTVIESIDLLLDMDASDDMIRSWQRSVWITICDLNKDIETLDNAKGK